MCSHTPPTPSDGFGLQFVRHMSETSRLFQSVSAAGAPSTQVPPTPHLLITTTACPALLLTPRPGLQCKGLQGEQGESGLIRFPSQGSLCLLGATPRATLTWKRSHVHVCGHYSCGWGRPACVASICDLTQHASVPLAVCCTHRWTIARWRATP